MSGFPLLNSAPVLVVQIIAKAEWKSNFRLRQTCKYLKKFIETTSGITVRVKGQFHVRLQDDTSLKLELSRVYINYYMGLSDIQESSVKDVPIDIESCYGTRLHVLYFPSNCGGETWITFCDLLKKLRITCDEAIVSSSFWTAEENAAAINILKASKIYLRPDDETYDYDNLEAIFSCRTLRGAHANTMAFEDSLVAMKALLPRFQQVEILVEPSAECYGLLLEAFQILVSTTAPNLQEFYLWFGGNHPFSQEELDKEIPGLDWIHGYPEGYDDEEGDMKAEEQEGDQEAVDVVEDAYYAVVQLPPHFSQGSSCRIVVETYKSILVTYELYYTV